MTGKTRLINNKSRWIIVWLACMFMNMAVAHAQQSGGITLNPQIAALSGSQLEVPPGTGQPNAYLVYTPATGATPSIRNIVSFSVREAGNIYIPEDFNATLVARVEYGTAGLTEQQDITFSVSYTKAEGAVYNARKYFSFENAKYVKVSVVRFTPSVASLSNGVKVSDLLLLENEMRVTHYYTLAATNNIPAFEITSARPDELFVYWSLNEAAGHNQYQLEWTWLDNEMRSAWYNSGTTTVNTDLLFQNNATRVDLPYTTSSYNIPLLYDGPGVLYYRVRAANINSGGSVVTAPWSAAQTYNFGGHQNSMNWQAVNSFAEDGKRKTVVQYYDGSLRSRQTVTKDNVTNTTITAETFYDGQGRPAIQILPAPGIDNVIGYTKNLNLFNQQSQNSDPALLFDLVAANAPTAELPVAWI